MIAIKIKSTKNFMAKLLASEVFDAFLLDSAEIAVANTYTIDGHINKEFYGEDEEGAPTGTLTPWSEVRQRCFDLIKGKRTPLSFKFLLCLNSDKKDELLSSEEYSEVRSLVSSLVMIIKFKDGAITITTGAALSGFSMDKSYEKLWDNYVTAFLDSSDIEFEEL
jgi:hypothetical protein